jgi:hypothetical protein
VRGLNSKAATLSLGESSVAPPGLEGRLRVATEVLSSEVLVLLLGSSFGGEPIVSPGGPRGAKKGDGTEIGLEADHGLEVAAILVLLDRLRCHRLGDALGLPLPILPIV